ncbi:MAG: hypothetical protein ACOC2J_00935 [bacterium]
MKRKINRNYKSVLKGAERAMKLRDLEIAKSLEIDMESNKLSPDELRTPVVRSDLPKE